MAMVKEDNAINLAKLILIGMAVQLVVILYVFYTDYEGRKDLVRASREGCERDKVSRMASAHGWRIAQEARIADGDYKVAEDYANLAHRLEVAGNINCNVRHPKASLLP